MLTQGTRQEGQQVLDRVADEISDEQQELVGGEFPGTQYGRFLAPKAGKRNGFWNQKPKYWVLGPSGSGILVWSCTRGMCT